MLRAYGVDFCLWLLASVGSNPLCPPRFAESSLIGLLRSISGLSGGRDTKSQRHRVCSVDLAPSWLVAHPASLFLGLILQSQPV